MKQDSNSINKSVFPVRVCFVSPKAYPLFNPQVKAHFGGAEVDLYTLAAELAKDKNFVVSFVTADYGQKQFEVIEGVRIIKSLDFKRNTLSGAIKVWRAMRLADAEIYIVKSESGVPLVASFCLLRNKSFVYRTSSSAHCDGTYIKKHPFYGRIFKWAVQSAKTVTSQSERDKLNLKKHLNITAVMIKNGHRIKENPETKRDTILWVGRSISCKKPFMFVELAQKIPQENFAMICQQATGDNRYEKLVQEAAKVKNLRFIKSVPFKDISSYFGRAKVFVNTSDIEGFPNTFIQACLTETPILSLHVNPDEFLNKYECGLCAEGEWDKFTEGLKTLLKPDKRQEYGRNGLDYAKQNHDITKIVEEYKKIFTELAK